MTTYGRELTLTELEFLAQYELEMREDGVPGIAAAVRRRLLWAEEARQRILVQKIEEEKP